MKITQDDNLHRKGFTLLEVLLSVALITLLAGISLPIARIMLVRNNLDSAAVQLTHSLRRAQTLSQAVEEDASWGAHIQSGTITLFKGASYETRDSTADEISEISSYVAVGGVTQVSFTKLTGLPQTTGTITLSSENESTSISINEKGTISY